MIKEDNILINISNRNSAYYKEKGYVVKVGELTKVKISDLSINSHEKIVVMCDLCDEEHILMYYKYLQNYNRHNFYSCKNCSRKKAKLTNNTLYGKDSYIQTLEGRTKYENTCMLKYGVTNTLLVPEIQTKIQNTFLLKYNSKSPLTDTIIKQKTIDTNIKRYGAVSYNKSIFFKNKIHKNWISFYNDKLPIDYNITDFFIIDDNKLKIKCNIHNDYYETSYKLLYQRTKLYNVCPCTVCNSINNNISWAEQEIFNFISEYTVTEQTNKDVLNGKHLDIYCKDINLAIEYNGVFWHSEKYKDNDYHFNKSIDTKNKNIKLFHIFENEWKNNNENIKTLLINYINKSYASVSKYKIKTIKKENIKYKDIFNGVISEHIYELSINNDSIANISFNDKYITYFNYNVNYDPTIIFDIFIKELNLVNHYYIHDNNNIFLNTTNFSFIKYNLPDYKYINFNNKKDIEVCEKVIIESSKKDIEICNENYLKLYDSGYTVYSFSSKHKLYKKDITDFLVDNNILYFIENNNYCFYTTNNMKFEICYVDSLNHSLNNIDIKYFYNLSINAENNNSFKFWIKDYEWENVNQRDILKSYILHASNKTTNKIYARDCEVQVIDNKVARLFEKENCFYGKRGASLNLGLVLKKDKNGLKAGTLVMLYTFGYNFFAKNENIIEIIRVGTLKYHYVCGGSSKLFNHFIKHYKTLKIGKKEIIITEIKFYSDYDHNIGNSLKNLNFIFIGYSKGGIMNYWIKENVIKHRQPMKYNQIKEKINNNDILVIPNAGVKIFKYIL